MNLSANEIASTLRKAGRGAGLDDGTAHDVAAAALRATAAGEDGVAEALRLFDEPDAARSLVAAADLLAAGETAEVPSSMLVPFLTDDAEAPHGAYAVDTGSWERILLFAHRTYVPASEASRLAGAGAGTTDND